MEGVEGVEVTSENGMHRIDNVMFDNIKIR